MAVKGFSFGRSITLDTSAAACPIDGYKALLTKVQEFENRVAAGETLATIAPGSEIVVPVTSKTAYRVYIFSISANFTTGAYVAELVEIAPNVEEATTPGIG